MPSNSSHSAGGLYGRLVAAKPQGISKYRSMQRDLDMFDAVDLYDYACPADATDGRAADPDALVARTEERVKDFRRDTSERSAAERLSSRAHEIFGDEVDRRRYDDYLQWCELKAVFDGLDQSLDDSRVSCTEDDVADELRELARLLGSRSQATALMESYLDGRGIEYDDVPQMLGGGEDDLISTPQGRAQVRRELSAMNVLPDSALRPSTPDPYRDGDNREMTRPVQARPDARPVQAGQPVAAGAGWQGQGQGASYVQCGACGALNTPGQGYCRTCGQPMGPQVSGAMPAVTGGAAAQEGGFPTMLVVLIALVAILLAGTAACVALNGVPGSSGGSSQSASSASATKQITSGSVDPVACANSSRIMPLDRDENPFEHYRVELVPRSGGSDPGATWSMSGTAGFTFSDLNKDMPAALEEGTYEVVITEDNSHAECRFMANYKPDRAGAVENLTVVAAS